MKNYKNKTGKYKINYIFPNAKYDVYMSIKTNTLFY